MSASKITNDKQLKKDYQTMSSGEIAEKYNCTRTTACRHLRRLGITRPLSGINSRNRKRYGEVIKTGYPVLHLPDHLRASAVGYVFKHILEWEKVWGYLPKRGEPIHHIDLDRKNYNIDNLYMFANGSQHQKAHSSLDVCVSKLIKKGKIKFEAGRYFLP